MLDLAIIGGIAFFVLAIAYIVSQKLRIGRSFAAIARTHGLELTPGAFPRAAGQIDGRDIVVESYAASDSPMAHFRIAVTIPGAPPSLGILQAQPCEGDVQTGDPEFHRVLMAKTGTPDAAKAWLTPPRRAALVALCGDPDYVMTEGALCYISRGFTPSEAWMEERLRKLLAAAADL